MLILAVPLPQFMYPPCVLCCDPCDGVDTNNVEYSVGEVDPFFNNNVQPIGNIPIEYGFDPNIAQVDLYDQQEADAFEPTDNSNEPPSDTDSVPSDDNTGSDVSNGLDNPMENLVRATLSNLVAEHGNNLADFTNAVNDFLSRMEDNKTM